MALGKDVPAVEELDDATKPAVDDMERLYHEQLKAFMAEVYGEGHNTAGGADGGQAGRH